MSIRRNIIAAVLTAAIALGTSACAMTNENVKEETIALEAVSSLEADLLSTDLKIKLGNENKVHYRVYESLAPTIKQNGTRLSIESGKGKSVRMFSKAKDNYIEITLDSKELGDIDIEASSGDILLDGFDIGGKVKTSSGDIEIKNVGDGKDISIEASSGDVDMSGCNFKTVNKKTSSGDCKFSDVIADSFVLEAKSGNTDISGPEVCDIRSESNSGDVDISFKGKRDDCNYDITVSSGDININGGHYDDDFTENNASDKTIMVKTSSGDITIDLS